MKIAIEGDTPDLVRIRSDHDYDETISFLVALLDRLLPAPDDRRLDDSPPGPHDTVS